MKKSTIILLAVLGVILLIAFSVVSWGVSTYNSFVTLDQGVKSQWSQVENQYQRRMDLIPNLVETVKGYATHESSTFEEVANARASAGKIVLTPEILKDPQMFAKFEQAQTGLSSALTHLMAVAENYPQLKANENFLQLQAQLEGTENRIATERRRFNEVVQDYNTRIRVFPSSIIAGMNGFGEKSYFQAEAGADVAPKVKF